MGKLIRKPERNCWFSVAHILSFSLLSSLLLSAPLLSVPPSSLFFLLLPFCYLLLCPFPPPPNAFLPRLLSAPLYLCSLLLPLLSPDSSHLLFIPFFLLPSPPLCSSLPFLSPLFSLLLSPILLSSSSYFLLSLLHSSLLLLLTIPFSSSSLHLLLLLCSSQ